MSHQQPGVSGKRARTGARMPVDFVELDPSLNEPRRICHQQTEAHTPNDSVVYSIAKAATRRTTAATQQLVLSRHAETPPRVVSASSVYQLFERTSKCPAAY